MPSVWECGGSKAQRLYQTGKLTANSASELQREQSACHPLHNDPNARNGLLKQAGSGKVDADAATDHVESRHGFERRIEGAMRRLQLT